MDQFYTKEEVASNLYKKFLEIVDTGTHDFILEPSAGKGAFFKLLHADKRIGIDLDPKYEGIECMNFFDFTPTVGKKYAVIGNPPFGRVSSTAVKFFNKASEFSEVIAFIVPRTFNRVSVQNKLNANFNLIFSMDLPVNPCCFEPKMSAKCCFQIWKRCEIPREYIRRRYTHPDFEFIKYGPVTPESGVPSVPVEEFDITIRAYGSSCGKVVTTDGVNVKAKSHHFIKSNIPVDELVNRLSSLDFSVAKNTCRQDSIGKADLVEIYSSKYP
jgi:hypothetical protein